MKVVRHQAVCQQMGWVAQEACGKDYETGLVIAI
jgi:hypothetical protein